MLLNRVWMIGKNSPALAASPWTIGVCFKYSPRPASSAPEQLRACRNRDIDHVSSWRSEFRRALWTLLLMLRRRRSKQTIGGMLGDDYSFRGSSRPLVSRKARTFLTLAPAPAPTYGCLRTWALCTQLASTRAGRQFASAPKKSLERYS